MVNVTGSSSKEDHLRLEEEYLDWNSQIWCVIVKDVTTTVSAVPFDVEDPLVLRHRRVLDTEPRVISTLTEAGLGRSTPKFTVFLGMLSTTNVLNSTEHRMYFYYFSLLASCWPWLLGSGFLSSLEWWARFLKEAFLLLLILPKSESQTHLAALFLNELKGFYKVALLMSCGVLLLGYCACPLLNIFVYRLLWSHRMDVSLMSYYCVHISIIHYH